MSNPMTAAGDIIVGGESGSPSKLAKGSAGQVLKSTSGGVEWGTNPSGFENPMTAAGDIIVGGESGSPNKLAKGTAGQVLKAGTGAIGWADESSSYSLPTASAETLGGVKIGDGLTIDGGVLSADGQSYTLPIASSGTLGGIKPDGTTITVDGETGVASAASSGGMSNPMTAAGDIIVGGESGSPSKLAKGSVGQVLKSTSGGVEWGTNSAEFENPMTTAGDIIVGGESGSPSRLAKGSAGQLLRVGSGGIEWIDAMVNMPSTQYVDFTVGATGSTYTVPSDGWIFIRGYTLSTNGYFKFFIPMPDDASNQLYAIGETTYQSGREIFAISPINSGVVCQIMHNNLEFRASRFIYAKGAI
jgi:hypothetical protein